jgi:FkbM family methyltransferase
LRSNNFFNYVKIIDYYNKYKLWGSINLDNNNFELIDRNAKTLIEHRKDFKWLYNHLSDYKSKIILLNILYFWLMLDFKKISQLQDKTFSQYFDLDLIKCDKEEVFVDIGAFVGDTLVDYAHTFGNNNYKKFYCYEIAPSSIEVLKENIDIFKLKNVVIKQKGASNKKGYLFLSDDDTSSTSTLKSKGNIKVETVKIDDDINEKITFIKMDIEGMEEKALLGCRKKILEDHPKLAISAYHNNDHLWKLARLIYKTDKSYKFYLRYYGGNLVPTEYILYAI